MQDRRLGMLALIGVLSCGGGPGFAQEQDEGAGLGGVIIDSNGAMFDPETGRRLTAEELAAELARRTSIQEEPIPPAKEPVGEEPLADDESPEAPATSASGREFLEEAAPAAAPPSSRSVSPTPPSSPLPQRADSWENGGEEAEEGYLPDFTGPDQAPGASFPKEGSGVVGQPGQPSSSLSSLLPSNSPVARLLQDDHYTLEEARLIAGPRGNWLTLREAQKQRYREEDIRALLQLYQEARQALQRGDQPKLSQTLKAFWERLDRLNRGSGGTSPTRSSRDLEALRQQLQAGILPASITPLGSFEPEPESPRFPWGLLLGGLAAVGLLGGGLAVRRWLRPRRVPALPVKGQVIVVRGPDAGKVWEVNGERILVGRGEECQVKLTDAALSPTHVVLTREADGIHVASLDPALETWLNGRPITAALLEEGDVVEIGQTGLSFEPAKG